MAWRSGLFFARQPVGSQLADRDSAQRRRDVVTAKFVDFGGRCAPAGGGVRVGLRRITAPPATAALTAMSPGRPGFPGVEKMTKDAAISANLQAKSFLTGSRFACTEGDVTRTNVGLGKSSTICAVLLFAAALLSAASASADEIDDAFVAALENYGININDHNAAITMGHNVCAALDNGHDESFLVLDVIHDTNLSAREAGYFLGVSVAAYCPQYKGTLDPSLRPLLPAFPPMM
jgi:hypothetical protein